MKITINPPLSLHETGKRANNEDSIFPPKGTATVGDRFFIVADGMGGHQGGEAASRAVCEAFAEFLQQMPDSFDSEMFQQALEYAYRMLDERENERNNTDLSEKSGTTLAFLCFHTGGVLMAHIGDSRIYHLRPNGRGSCEILYRSQDHSLVNELLAAGIITEEEARHHPKRNIITRAMQPHQSKQANADIKETADVQWGDYFFMCSDGVLESIDDDLLCEIVGAKDSDEEKMKAIGNLCAENSRDNFSGYLVSVAAVVKRRSLLS